MSPRESTSERILPRRLVIGAAILAVALYSIAWLIEEPNFLADPVLTTIAGALVAFVIVDVILEGVRHRLTRSEREFGALLNSMKSLGSEMEEATNTIRQGLLETNVEQIMSRLEEATASLEHLEYVVTTPKSEWHQIIRIVNQHHRDAVTSRAEQMAETVDEELDSLRADALEDRSGGSDHVRLPRPPAGGEEPSD